MSNRTFFLGNGGLLLVGILVYAVGFPSATGKQSPATYKAHIAPPLTAAELIVEKDSTKTGQRGAGIR